MSGFACEKCGEKAVDVSERGAFCDLHSDVDQLEALLEEQECNDARNRDLVDLLSGEVRNWKAEADRLNALAAQLRRQRDEAEARATELEAERDSAVNHRDDYEDVSIEAGIERRQLKARITELEQRARAEQNSGDADWFKVKKERDQLQARITELEQQLCPLPEKRDG